MAKFDVIISGAGPAGSTLAYNLANEGIEVLLLEKEALPRNKPCGGAVSFKSARLLGFPWQESVEDIIHTVELSFAGSGGVRVRPEFPVAFMVSRSNFDRILVHQAAKAGANVLENHAVSDVFFDRDRVVVSAGGKTFQGKIFAGADGTRGNAARLLGLHRPGRAGPALEAEIEWPPELGASRRGVAKLDCGAVTWGYGWVFPKKNHLSVGIGVFSRNTRDLRRKLDELLVREGLDGSEITRLQGHTIPLDGGLNRRIHNGPGFLVGDAAGFADPFSGEGIYYAVKSGQLAAEAVAANKTRPWLAPAYYQSLADRYIRSELAAARRFAKIFYSFPHLVFRLIEKHPFILQDLCASVYGSICYNQLKKLGMAIIREITSGDSLSSRLFRNHLKAYKSCKRKT